MGSQGVVRECHMEVELSACVLLCTVEGKCVISGSDRRRWAQKQWKSGSKPAAGVMGRWGSISGGLAVIDVGRV